MMDIQKVNELIQKIKDNEHTIDISGPESSDLADRFTKETGYKLPDSYLQFAYKYGTIGIYDNYLNGIEDLLKTTKVLTEQGEVPKGFIVLKMHEDGAYCFDFSRQQADRECPIVNFEYTSIQHEVPVSTNFEEFLFTWFLEDWAEEEGS